jgi:hypothetical protein
VGEICGTNGGEEERIEVVGRTAKRIEVTRKTKTKVGR